MPGTMLDSLEEAAPSRAAAFLELAAALAPGLRGERAIAAAPLPLPLGRRP